MKRRNRTEKKPSLSFALEIAITASFTFAVLGCGSTASLSSLTPTLSQAAQAGLVDDWSHHHLIFSNPGSEEQAVAQGRWQQWNSVVNSQRYATQQIRRNFMWPGGTGRPPVNNPLQPVGGPPHPRTTSVDSSSASQGKWTMQISNTKPGGVNIDMYPAKYSFAPISAPDCINDYVVFPVNVAGSSSQAQIVGMNNLYSGCAGFKNGQPTVRFAYTVGTGTANLSPALSLDGTKVLWAESHSTGTNGAGSTQLVVVTLDTPGASGNGTLTAPVAPGTGNHASDVLVSLSNPASDTDSPPYVDYDNDTAYIGDDKGLLHKVTGVFYGTPTEVTTAPWPMTVVSGTTNLRLTGPIYDQVSKRIFIAGRDNGNLYCIQASGSVCATPSVALGSGIQDAPIVDSTNQTVFVVTDTPATNGLAAVTQINTSLAAGSKVVANIGQTGMDLYDGAFDNAYYNNPASGHFYACGGGLLTAVPTLYSIGFAAGGQMSTTAALTTFQLSGATGTPGDCSPITEAFNPTTNDDVIYVSVASQGFSSLLGFNLLGPTCGTGILFVTANPCVISFDVTNGLPTQAKATFIGSSGTDQTSGFIIDNFASSSTSPSGAAQIYYGDLTNGLGTQLSQAGLQ